MRTMAEMVMPVLLVGCLMAAVGVAGEPEGSPPPPPPPPSAPPPKPIVECNGPYKGRRPTLEQLAIVLRDHQAWLKARRNPQDGRRANLCQADLRDANLQGARLDPADLQGVLLNGAQLQGALLTTANLQGPTWARLSSRRLTCGGPTSRGLSMSLIQEHSPTFGP